MQIYHYVPYGKIIFYVFTILFHLYLLVRSAAEARYIMAAILVIPVVAVSAVLFKFLKKTAINVFLNGSSVELTTAFDKFNLDIKEAKMEGNEILTLGRRFSVNQQKARDLFEVLDKNS